MSSALVLLSPGFEEIEAVTIIDLLRRGDIEVTVAGLQKEWVGGSHHIAIRPDVYYLNVNPNDFDWLILPGGQPGTNHLKEDSHVLQWVKQRFGSEKKLAAICAAPTVFATAGIADGLKLTSYPSEREIFKNSRYLEESVVRDGNILTSRGVGTAIEFSLALIADLKGKEKADEVRRRILYRE